MKYVLNGNLQGFYCGDCSDFLYKAKVKIYSADPGVNITALAVASENETFHQRTAEELASLQKRFLLDAETDAWGNFTIDFSRVPNYNGEAFDVDFECGSVPLKFDLKNPPKPYGPFQFHITTLQPLWREQPNMKGTLLAGWKCAISSRYWCSILKMFHFYVICGKVVDCEKKTPISGLHVKAFDVDLIQDDYLGMGVTDVDGTFKIYYTEADFTKTIFTWLNVEWPAGPDLYFSIESGSGTVIVKEPRSRGHQRDRANASNCFCVELCVTGQGGEGGTYAPVLFQRVGNYWIASDFDSQGFTNDSERNAFTGHIPLVGAVPAPFSSTALEYRFLVKNLDTSVSVVVDNNLMVPFEIGTWNHFVSAIPYVADSLPYYVNLPSAPHNVVMAPDGWIAVPREKNYFSPAGQFSPGTTLGILDTDKLVMEYFDLISPTVYVAGQPFPAAKKASVHNFEITCEVREVGNPAVSYSNVLQRIAICNTQYLQRLHPSWAGGDTAPYAVVMLELAETTLSGAGCNKVNNTITAVYSVVHPVIDSLRIYFEGNGTGSLTLPLPPPPTPPVPIPIVGNAAVGSHTFDITMLASCAYIVWLQANFRLTSGYGRISSSVIWDHIAFCKA